MARKKQEVQLQAELETQEEYEDMLSKEGLIVVDVYQEWCGPCKAIISNFRKLKNELGDDLLRFAVAKADTIDSLEKYRGRCEPCFLMVAAGMLVSVIHSANAPVLIRTITEQLAQEHRVLDGQAERKEIRDPHISQDDEELEGLSHQGENVIFDSLPQSAAEFEGKDVTVAILKPDVVAAGKVDEILQKLADKGIEVLEQQEKQFTEEEARKFYSHKAEEEYFEDMIHFMTSAPSIILVLTKADAGEGIIDEWREMLGPAKVEDAKESAPDSLRAQYGNYTYINALHGSDTKETAMKELAFFFPSFAAARSVHGKPQVQRTLALIRPDALSEKKDEILAKIKEAGFTIAMQKTLQLTQEQVENFYSEHKEEEYFDELVAKMTSGPVMALALARVDAVNGWRELLGPKVVSEAKQTAPESLRAEFSKSEDTINPIHGSDMEHAEEEIKYFFPMQHTVALIKPDAYESRDAVIAKIEEAGFNVAAKNEISMTKDLAEAFYKDQSGKEFFDNLTDHMISGKTLFMVLTKEDAVEGWRSMLGPADPDLAKEEAPDSLRAQFGTDILSNAIHGSSNEHQADEAIKLVLGDVEFKPDGTCVGEGIEEVKPELTPASTEVPKTPVKAEAEPVEAKEVPVKVEVTKTETDVPVTTPEAGDGAEQPAAPETITEMGEEGAGTADAQPDADEQAAGTVEKEVAESEKSAAAGTPEDAAMKEDAEAKTEGDTEAKAEGDTEAKAEGDTEPKAEGDTEATTEGETKGEESVAKEEEATEAEQPVAKEEEEEATDAEQPVTKEEEAEEKKNEDSPTEKGEEVAPATEEEEVKTTEEKDPAPSAEVTAEAEAMPETEVDDKEKTKEEETANT